MKFYKMLLVIFLCFALVPALFAQGTTQDTGLIRGTIKDAQGSPIPGVTITVTSPSIMKSQSTPDQ